MNIDYSPRGSGKTTRMINAAAKKSLYIVCLSHQEVIRISNLATSMGLYIPFPLTYDEFISGRFNRHGINGFMIDNADLLLQRMARGVPVVGINLTEEK